jgi:hypothetical protein
LEEDLETHERIDLQDPDPVDSTVARLPGDRDLLESRFTKQALTETFESLRREFPQEETELRTIVPSRIRGFLICGAQFLGESGRGERRWSSACGPLDSTDQLVQLLVREVGGGPSLLGKSPDTVARGIDESVLREIESRPGDIVVEPRHPTLIDRVEYGIRQVELGRNDLRNLVRPRRPT